MTSPEALTEVREGIVFWRPARAAVKTAARQGREGSALKGLTKLASATYRVPLAPMAVDR
jgi:hypothetical protein